MIKKSNPLFVKIEELQRKQAKQHTTINTMLKEIEIMAQKIDSFYEGTEELLNSNYQITLQIEELEKKIMLK